MKTNSPGMLLLLAVMFLFPAVHAVEPPGSVAAEQAPFPGRKSLFEVIHKKDTGHHPHSLEDPTPIVEFIEKHVEKRPQ